MRTLKKTLALVLAVVMCFGMFAIGANAAYSDAGKINANFAEAVDVMSGIGVISGMGDNTFAPTGSLTRAQACRIVVAMLLGANANKISAGSGTAFKDVPAKHWASGYVEYCANLGIVNGYGDGNFGPDAALNTAAWALMLLQTIGYKSANESISGDTWAVATAALAVTAGLSNDAITLSSETVCTREMACQMAFQALKAVAVQYTGGTSVNVGGTTITTGATRSNIANTTTNYIEGTGAVQDNLMQFCEKNFPTLKLNLDVAADDFGRPATQWKFGNPSKVIGTYSKKATLSYTVEVSSAKIFADLGLSADLAADKTVTYVDGKFNADTFAINHADTASKLGGNGCLTEVFYDATAAKPVTIVCINTYVGAVTDVTEATAVSKRNVTVTGDAAAAAGNGFASGKFETASFAEKDVVLYTVAETASDTFSVKTLQKITPTTLTATGMSANSFTANGTTYKYSAYKSGTIVAADVTGKVAKEVYFDNYGYAIKVANPSTAVPPLAVVIGVSTSATLDGTTYNVRLLKADGTTEDVVASAAPVSAYTGSAVGTTGEYKLNEMVTYSKNSAGKYVLTSVDETKANTAAITKGVVTFTADGSTSLKANAKTIFFVKTVNASTKVPTYNVYVGISNVPTITVATNSASYTVSGAYVTAVYVDTATLKDGGTTSKDVIYVTTKGAVDKVDVTLGEYTTYNAVVNGEITTINATKGYFTADGIYVAVTKNDKGLISAATEMTVVSPITAYVDNATGTTKAADGVLGIDAAQLTYSDTTTVYTVSATGVITKTSVASVKTDANDTVIYYTTGNVLTSAFITVVDNAPESPN